MGCLSYYFLQPDLVGAVFKLNLYLVVVLIGNNRNNKQVFIILSSGMKIGIQKVSENEWLLKIGYVILRLDRISMEKITFTLNAMLKLEKGAETSTFTSYLHLSKKLKQLSSGDVQVLTREVNNQDLVVLLGYAKDQELNNRIFENLGGILAKQMEADLLNNLLPVGQEATNAVGRVVETLYRLDSEGKIEFINEDTQYI